MGFYTFGRIGTLVAFTLVVSNLCAAEDRVSSTPIPTGFQRDTLVTNTGGLMNYYLRKGEGPTLVLVPGTWGGVWRFETLIAQLPEAMSIAVVELCWQDKHNPPKLDFAMEQLADDVLGAIDAMGVEKFVIAGHSIGGMIAVEIAGRTLPGLVGAIPMEGWTHHTVVKTAFDGVVVSDLSPEEEAWSRRDRARGRDHLSETEINAIGSIWKNWNGYPCLERSTVPILEIWGDRGKAHADFKALQIPEKDNITVAWIPNASHLVLLEDPEEVARLIREFMAKFEGAVSAP